MTTMTANDIRAAISASPELQALAPDTEALAAALSVGRTRAAPTEAGNGLVLEVLGLAVGNALLDVLYSQPAYRHVRPLLEQGRLRLDAPLVAMALGALVGQQIAEGVTFGAEHLAALLARARVPDPVSEYDVRLAIFADDGKLLV